MYIMQTCVYAFLEDSFTCSHISQSIGVLFYVCSQQGEIRPAHLPVVCVCVCACIYLGLQKDRVFVSMFIQVCEKNYTETALLYFFRTYFLIVLA